MKYISITVFFISFLIGILYIYLSKPELKVVKVSPTPDNCEQTLYKDKAENCFKYTPHEVPCKKGIGFFSIQN